MRNAALVLGLFGGVLALIVGFASYGYTEAVDRFGEVPNLAEQVANPAFTRTMSVLAPILAIAGGAMAKIRALWGGILMLASAAALYWGFGFNVFTVFPLVMCLTGGVLAVAAGKPDEPRSHF